MVTAAEVRKLAARLAKAEALVAAGGVSVVKGVAGYYAVASSAGDGVYLVHLHDDGTACCSCADWQQRGKTEDRPCKHILSSQIVAESGKVERPVEEPAVAPARWIDGAAALRRLSETEDAFPMAAD